MPSAAAARNRWPKSMQKLGLVAKGIKAGGFDLTEQSQKLLKEGNIEFTIDQQPYLQGFLPVLQLFLWQVSGSLTGPAEVDTGLSSSTKKPSLRTSIRSRASRERPPKPRSSPFRRVRRA